VPVVSSNVPNQARARYRSKISTHMQLLHTIARYQVCVHAFVSSKTPCCGCKLVSNIDHYRLGAGDRNMTRTKCVLSMCTPCATSTRASALPNICRRRCHKFSFFCRQINSRQSVQGSSMKRTSLNRRPCVAADTEVAPRSDDVSMKRCV